MTHFVKHAWVWLLCVWLGSAQALTQVIDDRGVVVKFERSPQRIVSLLPSLTETVCALDACSRLVGVDRYSNHPVSVRQLPNVGGQDDTNVEAVVALRPDLVLVSKSSRVAGRLERLGIKVLALGPEGYEDVKRVADVVAKVLGDVAAGDRLWVKMESQVNAAVAAVPAEHRGRSVYFEVDSTPYAAGEASFIGYLVKRMGLRNIVTPELGPFPKLNPEFVVRANPHIIMVSDKQRTAIAARPGWSAIQAVKDKRICTFTTDAVDIITRPGPRFGEAALTLSACLQKLAQPEGKR